MDPDKLWLDLSNGHLWLILLGAAIFGAIGSLLRPPPAPASDAAQSPPPPPPNRGWVALSGAAAAVALVYVSKPESGAALIGGSIVAGFAANAVLAGLQARVLAATAEVKATASAQLAEARGREALQASHDVEQLARAAEDGQDVRPLVREIRARRADPAGAPA